MNINAIKAKYNRIKDTFRKNGMQYKLFDRSQDWAIFKLFGESGAFVAVEVCRIYRSKVDVSFHTAFIPAGSEYLTSNTQFGKDGSFTLPPRFEHEATVRFKRLSENGIKPLSELMETSDKDYLFSEIQSYQNASTDLLNVKESTL